MSEVYDEQFIVRWPKPIDSVKEPDVSDLNEFAQLSDDDAGSALGFTGKLAASRGAFARKVAAELLGVAAKARYGLHDIKSAIQKEALDRFFFRFPEALERTEGYLPRTDAVMAVVAHRIGSPITSENLELANACCSEIVTEAISPRLRRFVRDTLMPDGAPVSLDEDGLIDFLIGPYSQYAKSASAGLVSVAGNLNEGLVRSALVSSGVQAVKTGTEGNADLQVVAPNLSPPQTLNIEIKSYGARERLLRGLQDCNTPKIGVGFFNKSSEFNASRTGLLLGTNASAIYLPLPTLEGLDETTRKRQNAQGGVFYRPLSSLGNDMIAFSNLGVKAFG